MSRRPCGRSTEEDRAKVNHRKRQRPGIGLLGRLSLTAAGTLLVAALLTWSRFLPLGIDLVFTAAVFAALPLVHRYGRRD